MTGCCAEFGFIIEDTEEFEFEFTECFNVISGEVYEGEYDVIPKAWEMQILDTKQKTMTDDVRVHEIPYDETANEYGTTCVIAS